MDRQIYAQKLETLKKIQKDDHHALRIAMCGKFKSGKSSLLNLMLGINLPVKSTTATGIVTKIAFGNMSSVKMKSEEIKDVSGQELHDYISIVEKDLDGVTIGDARCAYVGAYSKILRYGKVEFWDTPGLEDDPMLTEITMNAIYQCDFLIYVMHAAKALSQYEKMMFIKLDKLMNGNIIFVVNHMDSLNSDERDSITASVNKVLGNYSNKYFPGGSIFFTSADPNNPDISSLSDALLPICSQKEKRIGIMNNTKKGKFAVLEEELMEYICYDAEEVEQNIIKFQQLLKDDIENKRQELERCYNNCVNSCERIQKNLEASVLDESAWRLVLVNYQSVSGWETNFVGGASERIKGRMAELIQNGNEEMQKAVYGTIFKSDHVNIVLDEKNVWKKANWYKNFSRPILFPEKRFKQFCTDCVEVCIGALMKGPAVIANNSISAFFSSFFSLINSHYVNAMAEIDGDPELLKSLENANSDREFIEDCKNDIAAIRDSVEQAASRNKLSYKLKDFFFTSVLSNEIYN